MDNNKKSLRLYLRITEEDKANIAYNSELLNISMSEYVLRCIRRKRIVVCENFPDLIFQLSKIGNNLNQIAIIANTNSYLSEDYIAKAKEYLKGCYSLMNKFISYICEPENNSEETFGDILNETCLNEIKNMLETINQRINKFENKF